MKFAAIAPTRVLCDEATGLYCRPLQFCLAHIYVKGGMYASFYKEQVQAGKEVILDNGEYEGQQTGFIEYWACIQDLKPTVAVLPDRQDSHIYTRRLHQDFLNFVERQKASDYHPQFMTVLHAEGGDMWEYLHQYINSDTQWVGFPSNIADWHGPEGRVVLAKQIQSIGNWKPAVRHHALSWNKDSLDEWGELGKVGFYSCDSSNPVWRRALGNKEGDIDFGWTGAYAPLRVRKWVERVDRICQ